MRTTGGKTTAKTESSNVIDISVKGLFRELPEAILRLAGLSVNPGAIRVEDPTLSLPELRADHVFIIDDEPSGTFGAIYVEYQLHPDPTLLTDWFVKCGGLTRQLGLPVSLLVLYLKKGDRATFPDSYSVSIGGLVTEFRFTAIRLWEHADRILNGEFPELAPLLVLCYNKPTEQTIRREIELIRGAGFPTNVQADLLTLAVRIASRTFGRTVLNRLFKEVIPLAKGSSFIDDWIEEGEVRGEVRGEARGEANEARRLAEQLLSNRFGELPDALVARIRAAEREWCEALLVRAMRLEAFEELDWQR